MVSQCHSKPCSAQTEHHQPSPLASLLTGCGFDEDSGGSQNSSKTLGILEIICNFLVCHRGLKGSQRKRQQGPTGSGGGAGSSG